MSDWKCVKWESARLEDFNIGRVEDCMSVRLDDYERDFMNV